MHWTLTAYLSTVVISSYLVVSEPKKKSENVETQVAMNGYEKNDNTTLLFD